MQMHTVVDVNAYRRRRGLKARTYRVVQDMLQVGVDAAGGDRALGDVAVRGELHPAAAGATIKMRCGTMRVLAVHGREDRIIASWI